MARQRNITPQLVERAATVLGVLQEFREHAQAPSHAIAKDRFDSMRLKAEQSYKRLARKHHPDLGGSIEKMQELNDARDLLKAISFVPQAQIRRQQQQHAQPVEVCVVVNISGSGFGGGWSTSTTSYGSGFGSGRGTGGF